VIDILTYNYELYQRDPNRNLSDPDVVSLHALHFQTETENTDVWRQHRLMEPVLERMNYTKNSKWLTVGDGAYGLESIRMRRKGFTDVLPTDIDGKLLQAAKDAGHISDYRVENGEKLSFADNSFDYVLCKDSYHHMPRPMIALYEMIRVARHAVVLIEPQDPWADAPLMAGPAVSGYESVGNYIYTISRRELEKVALGLDLPAIAFKGLFDHCPPAIEKIKVSPADASFNAYMRALYVGEDACREGRQKHNMLFAIIFKTTPDQALIDSIVANPDGWNVSFSQGNPHKKKFETN
jgi:SAM-dependent methyltransferase